MRSPDEIINDLMAARAKNNEHWGDLIRLAWSKAPDKAREISEKINAQDRVVVGLAEELARPPAAQRRVLIPGGGTLHTYTVREALALGLIPVVTDRDANCPCAKIPGVDFHHIDCYDVDAHMRLAERWHGLVGAFCAGAETHVVVAHVAEYIGSKWVSVKAAETCRDKRRQKDALLAAGVPTAAYSESLPCIWKPLSGSGSRGIRRFVSEKPLFGHDPKLTISEALLEGPEQSVEILLWDGAYRRINIVDRHFAWVNDQPLEWGHTNPTRLGLTERYALYELAFSSAKAVGAEVGFFKIDSILTKEGFKVLECTPRLSGGYDSQLSTPMSTGRNLIRYGLQLACGLETDESLLECSKSESVTVIHRPELAGAEDQKR